MNILPEEATLGVPFSAVGFSSWHFLSIYCIFNWLHSVMFACHEFSWPFTFLICNQVQPCFCRTIVLIFIVMITIYWLVKSALADKKSRKWEKHMDGILPPMKIPINLKLGKEIVVLLFDFCTLMFFTHLYLCFINIYILQITETFTTSS